MDNHQDEFLKIIKTIEATQQQLGCESDPDRVQHLREYLNLNLKRLTNLTHQNSVKESNREPEREI